MADLVKGDFKQHVLDGGFLCVDGACPQSLDATFLIARAFHLQGAGCLVVPVTELGNQISNPRGMDEDFEERLARAKCLVVTRFFHTDETDEGKPFTPRTINLIEDFLMWRRVDKQGTLLHTEDRLVPGQKGRWWHDGFVRTILEDSKSWGAMEGIAR